MSKMINFNKLLEEKSERPDYASRCHINSMGHEPILITGGQIMVYKAQCFEICSSQRCAYNEGGQE